MRSICSIVVRSAPATFLLLVASFLASRLLIGYDPGSWLAWYLFVLLTPFGREIGVFLPIGSAAAIFASAAFFLGLAFCAWWACFRAGSARGQFFMAHIGLLLALLATMDEGLPQASVAGLSSFGRISYISSVSLSNPALTLLVFALGVLCVASHRPIIWRMRHPVREVT